MLENQLAKTLSLDGAWDFALGSPPQWGQIQVPGCWEAQGYSKLVDGPAFYRRRVLIPPDWADEHIFIEFDAVSYAGVVRCDGVQLGDFRGLWTPFACEITSAVRPGEAALIELEVYKPGQRYPLRSSLAGFLPDVATSFGGIWQPARLRALTCGLEDVLVEPDSFSGQVRVCCRFQKAGVSALGSPDSWGWEAVIYAGELQVAAERLGLAEDGVLDMRLAVPQPVAWSPDCPALYELRLRLIQSDRPVAQVSRRFGFRQLEAQGGLLRFNGQSVLLRGVLSWGWQPERIAPAYTPEQVRAEIRRVKALGFNLIKLCLFVPDQTYFDVADEEGIFLWEELPLWLPEVTPELRAQAPLEYAAITRRTRDHPSVVLYSLGCELSQSVDAELLAALNAAVRSLLSGVLVCDNSGSGESYGGLDFDFSDFTDYHPYYDLHYFEPLLDNWRRDWLKSRPWIFGEFSDSDGFRDLDELAAANGGRKPWWLSADNPITTWRPEAHAMVDAEERLAAAGLGWPAVDLVRIAAAQSLVSRKYTLEALRRRQGMGGYVVTGLRDTPIATSGMFDDFDRPKWPAESVLAFNDDVILCLDGDRRRRWRNGGDRPDRLDVYNHWAAAPAHWHIILSTYGVPLEQSAMLTWRLCSLAGEALESGQVAIDRRVAAGAPAEIAMITCLLPPVYQACELCLEAALSGLELNLANTWPVWLYPQVKWPVGLGIYDPSSALDELAELLHPAVRLQQGSPGSSPSQFEGSEGGTWQTPLVVATAWSERLESYLRRGGRVLLLQQGDGPLPARRGPFWRENLRLFTTHPLWQVFPQQGYTNLQFFGLASDVMLDTARLPQALAGATGIRPLLRRMDAREFTMLDYLVEVQVGRGTLLACTLKVQGGAGAQPSGWQRNVAGAYLLWAMMEYLLSSVGKN